MRSRYTALLAFIALILSALAVTTASAPATAGQTSQTSQTSQQADQTPLVKRKGSFSEVHHAGNDAGYTAPIHIQCGSSGPNPGKHFWIGTGSWSGPYCGAFTDYIIPRTDQAVRCTDMTRPWEGWLYFTGGRKHYIDSFRTLKCYMQRPI